MLKWLAVIYCGIFVLGCKMQTSNDFGTTTPPVPSIIKDERALDLSGDGKLGGGGWIAGHVEGNGEYHVEIIAPDGVHQSIFSKLGNTQLADINNQGIVIGRVNVQDAPAAQTNAFVYTAAVPKMVPLLSILPAFDESKNEKYSIEDVNPIGINNSNVIVGLVRLNVDGAVAATPTPTYVFTWQMDQDFIELIKGSVPDISNTGANTNTDLPVSRVSTINNRRELALGCGDRVPCAFNSEPKLKNIYESFPIENLPIKSAFVQLNNAGIYGVEADIIVKERFVHAAALWSFKDGFEHLPAPAEYFNCYINGLNDAKVAVGMCIPPSGYGSVPVVWKNGATLDLNTGLTSKDNSYWSVRDIGEDGNILVSGKRRPPGNYELYVVTLK